MRRQAFICSPTLFPHRPPPTLAPRRSPSPSLCPRHPPLCISLPPPSRALPAASYAVYMSHLFLLSPTGSFSPLHSLSEALQLSLNFLYITPLLLPSLAPSLHPLLEAAFNLVVAWALLLVGFASEDLSQTNSNQPTRRVPAAPLLLATLFLTNIFYLPYLFLRTPPSSPLTAIPSVQRSPLQRLADSTALPCLALAMAAASVPWALFARPEFGGWAQRWETFVGLLGSDLLAHSFAVDCLVFALFQGWLVEDDAKRREWTGEKDGLVVMARFVPFVGLAVYLVRRARRASIRWVEDGETEEAAG